MSWFDSLTASLVPFVPKPIMRRLSTRYIAGEEREAALLRGSGLAKAGYRVTYDQLGEAVSNREEVDAAVEENLRLMEDLVAQDLERNISVKPTQLGLNLDEDFCYTSTARVVEKAREIGAFVRFEMEESETVDGTLRVFAKLRAEYGKHIGIVLQSMLFRTEEDVRQLLTIDQPLNVRVVKGIYVEPHDVAHQDGAEVNASYLRMVRMLAEGGAFIAAATHDEHLVAGVQEVLKEFPDAVERTEIQMLLGVREELRQEVRKMGLPVRVYVPYGDAWHKYVVRRLKKNPKLVRYAFLGMFGKSEKL